MLKSEAKWIWIGKDASPEEYACFKDSFFYRGGRVVLRIAAETDYIATVNGKTVGFGQFPGYPFEKYYDEFDVTEACTEGENDRPQDNGGSQAVHNPAVVWIPADLWKYIAIAAVVGLQCWKRNSLVSILGGTAAYRVLTQVF